MAQLLHHRVNFNRLTSNFALDRTPGSHSLAAAGHRDRWADQRASPR